VRARTLLITQAAEGTLFPDEIGDLTTASQVKLLRLLQDGSYYPLGADRPRQHRSRVIVATHYDVVQRVDEGAFRKDLYYQLRTHHLQLPPLRKRPEDLSLLVNHFLEKAVRALGKPVPPVPLALYQLLKTYSFPGNVRELEALVLDAVTRHQGRTLSLQSFKDVIVASAHLAKSETPPEAAPAAPLFPDPLPTLGEAD
jgi:DNA-binding NtrC family response regulator